MSSSPSPATGGEAAGAGGEGRAQPVWQPGGGAAGHCRLHRGAGELGCVWCGGGGGRGRGCGLDSPWTDDDAGMMWGVGGGVHRQVYFGSLSLFNNDWQCIGLFRLLSPLLVSLCFARFPWQD